MLFDKLIRDLITQFLFKNKLVLVIKNFIALMVWHPLASLLAKAGRLAKDIMHSRVIAKRTGEAESSKKDYRCWKKIIIKKKPH